MENVSANPLNPLKINVLNFFLCSKTTSLSRGDYLLFSLKYPRSSFHCASYVGPLAHLELGLGRGQDFPDVLECLPSLRHDAAGDEVGGRWVESKLTGNVESAIHLNSLKQIDVTDNSSIDSSVKALCQQG